MKKTLLVTYTPRDNSNTQKLVDTFISAVDTKTTITHLDLVTTPPQLLLKDQVNSYVKRNYMGQELTDSESSSLSQMDEMTQKLQNHDLIVIAYPIYNFSMPAAVKAWFDNVIVFDQTFTMQDSKYVGLLKNKTALVINTSAGTKMNSQYDFSTPLITGNLSLMGITDTTILGAFGMMSNSEQSMNQASSEITKYVDSLFVEDTSDR